MSYTVRMFEYLRDKEQVVALLEAEGYGRVAPEAVAGPAMVAVTEEGEVIGFIWSLVGHSTTAYLGYLVVDKRYKPREDIGLDISMALLAVLKEAGVKDIMVAAQHRKVQEVLKILGMVPLEEHVMMRGSLDKIAARLAKLFEDAPGTAITDTVVEMMN